MHGMEPSLAGQRRKLASRARKGMGAGQQRHRGEKERQATEAKQLKTSFLPSTI